MPKSKSKTAKTEAKTDKVWRVDLVKRNGERVIALMLAIAADPHAHDGVALTRDQQELVSLYIPLAKTAVRDQIRRGIIPIEALDDALQCAYLIVCRVLKRWDPNQGWDREKYTHPAYPHAYLQKSLYWGLRQELEKGRQRDDVTLDAPESQDGGEDGRGRGRVEGIADEPSLGDFEARAAYASEPGVFADWLSSLEPLERDAWLVARELYSGPERSQHEYADTHQISRKSILLASKRAREGFRSTFGCDFTTLNASKETRR